MASTIDRVMKDIREWPSDERLRLVNRIVETLLPNPSSHTPQNAENGKLRGKYRNSMRPSDAFAKNKKNEHQLEDRSI